MTLDSGRVLEAALAAGIGFVTGVPDSLLKHFCRTVDERLPEAAHRIATSEGSAVAMAAGYHLGTGGLALVYMQNSGFGNAVNPLLSLSAPDVVGIPMVLMVGWRGEPGRDDEPQHRLQGRVMEPLLRALEIPYEVLDGDTASPEDLFRRACAQALGDHTPFVLLVRAGTFEPHPSASSTLPETTLTREAAIEAVLDATDASSVVVCTTGMASRELFERRAARGEGHERDFLMVGSMGHAPSIALGLALARPELTVYCLDGDGALLMHLGSMAQVGTSGAERLHHILLNNGVHDSVGGQPTLGLDVSLPAVARACWYREARQASTPDEVRREVASLAALPGPTFLEIELLPGARADLGRPTLTPQAMKEAFMEFVRAQGAR